MVLVQGVTLPACHSGLDFHHIHDSIMGPNQPPCCNRGVCRCRLILDTQWCRLCGLWSLEEPSAPGSCRRWYRRLLAQAMRGVFVCTRLSHAWLSLLQRLALHISETPPLGWDAISACRIWETPLDDILHCRWEARSFVLDHTGFRESVGGHSDAAGGSQDSRSAFAISLWNQHHLHISLSLFWNLPPC